MNAGTQSLMLLEPPKGGAPDIDLERLSDLFPPEQIEWKPIMLTKDKTKGLAAAYVTNRAIMDRLDKVCTRAGWANHFTKGPDGGILCGISIHIGGGWITKWDGAENTDIEAVKGGLSSAMRRAGAQWGIGRYLYDLPTQWVSVDKYGKFTETPRLPAWAVPREMKKVQQPAQPTASIKALQAMYSQCGFTADDRAIRIDFARALMGKDFASFTELSDEDKAVLLKKTKGIADYLGSPEMVRAFADFGRDSTYSISDGHHCKDALDAFVKEQATSVM